MKIIVKQLNLKMFLKYHFFNKINCCVNEILIEFNQITIALKKPLHKV